MSRPITGIITDLMVERVEGSRDSEATTHVQAAEAALLGA
jgi:hypothetical protein